jgi:hypothetical protein
MSKEWGDPGSIARRLGYPESTRDAIARAEIRNYQDRIEAAKRQEDEVRWAVLREKERQEREDRKAVRRAAEAAGLVKGGTS